MSTTLFFRPADPLAPAPGCSAQPATHSAPALRSQPKFRSCLYECEVLHHRFAPKRHRFVYRLFYFYFDLDELPALHTGLRWLSINRRNILSLRERDFLPTAEPVHRPTAGRPALGSADAVSLKSRAVAFCAAHGVALGTDARVQLITLPRLFGYRFNPVSFYFCSDGQGVARGAIAEVTNTFHEVKAYFIPLDPRATSAGIFRLRVPKHFYVSPFSTPDVEFDFTVRLPAGELAIHIDDFNAGRRVFHSRLSGRRVSLTDARLAWYLFKYPLVTLRIVLLIHWQALRLWGKGVPFQRKAAHATGQRDLFRPHESITEPRSL